MRPRIPKNKRGIPSNSPITTLGDVIVPYKGIPMPLRNVLDYASLDEFEHLLRAWTQKTQRNDIWELWQQIKMDTLLEYGMQPYLSWILTHFDSFAAFLAAWRQYPIAVRRLFPSYVVTQLEAMHTNNLPDTRWCRDAMHRFCLLPFHPISGSKTT